MKKYTPTTSSGIFVQLRAAVRELDDRAGFRDGFTGCITYLPRASRREGAEKYPLER
jgi:hypothetical protein